MKRRIGIAWQVYGAALKMNSNKAINSVLLIQIQLVIMKKDHEDDQKDPDHFEVAAKMPPLHKNSAPHNANEHHSAHKSYDPISWELYFDELFYLSDGTSVFRAGESGALFFCIHGAGHSALSFATLAKQVKHFGTLVAFDLKGHGFSKKNHSNEDFSIQTLNSQTIQALKQLMQRFPDKNVVVVGHSLGGSIACRVVETLTNIQKIERIVGCVIIDVVEGTALQALPFMNQIISDRPKHFDSLQSAIKWCYNSCTVRKLESARVSFPGQLREYEKNGQKRWGWQVNLKETEKYWQGWFKGLSQVFLGIHVPKVLLTAEKERMDKELTIAQMQGRFKVVVIHNVGHSVQEDDHKATARELYNLLKDFRIPMTLQEKAEKELVGIAHFHPDLPKY